MLECYSATDDGDAGLKEINFAVSHFLEFVGIFNDNMFVIEYLITNCMDCFGIELYDSMEGFGRIFHNKYSKMG